MIWILRAVLILGVVGFKLQADPKKKLRSQAGKVLYNTAVYAKPDFDSKKIAILKAGQKVRISRKRYRHASGLGSFYRVKVNSRLYGFVADVDVQSQYGVKKKTLAEEVQEDIENSNKRRGPLGMTRFGGVLLGNAKYTEKVSNTRLDSNTSFFGLKLSGPGVLGVEMPIDFELLGHVGAPSYYSRFSEKASGFLLLGHLSLVIPFVDMKTAMMYYGLGLMYTFTNFEVTVRENDGGLRDIKSQELRGGLMGQLGYAKRFGEDWVGRAEVKYYFEQTQYFAIGMAVQHFY